MKSMKLRLFIIAAMTLFTMSANALEVTWCSDSGANYDQETRYTREYEARDLDAIPVDDRVRTVANYVLNKGCSASFDGQQLARPSLDVVVPFDGYGGGMWELSCGNRSGDYEIAVTSRPKGASGYVVGVRSVQQRISGISDCFYFYTFSQERDIQKKYGKTNQD